MLLSRVGAFPVDEADHGQNRPDCSIADAQQSTKLQLYSCYFAHKDDTM
jgi:hypothetical protein